MITGIVVALPEELGTLTRQKIAPGCSAFIAENCLVAVSGSGPENARRAAQRLIEQGARRLLSWGCAGALCATLKPGKLCVPAVFQSAGGRKFTSGHEWRRQICAALASRFDICEGPLLESAHIIAASAEKIQMGKIHGAQLVDMESYALADIAEQTGIPFLAVRAIADPAAMDLPRAIMYALQQNGQVALHKILFYVLTHPHEIVGLIKLGIHFHAAKNALKAARGFLPAIIAQ